MRHFTRRHLANLAHNTYSIGNGIKDNIQVYNIPKFDGFHERQQPPVLEDNIKEIETFAKVSLTIIPGQHRHNTADD